MAKLNDKNEKTEKVIHLLITEKCDRDCKFCCNKQYNMDEIPYASVDELSAAESIFLTGGEPFAHSYPGIIAFEMKSLYDVKNVYVYSNALELAVYRERGDSLAYIDGITISIKNIKDKIAFDACIVSDEQVMSLPSNRLYVFDGLYPKNIEKVRNLHNFEVFDREWKEEFVPADDSIFRKHRFYKFLEF